jgi:tetratricopeptide (TPR) repeat protein
MIDQDKIYKELQENGNHQAFNLVAASLMCLVLNKKPTDQVLARWRELKGIMSADTDNIPISNLVYVENALELSDLLQEAMEVCTFITSRTPNSAEAHYFLALVHHKMINFLLAEKSYQRAFSIAQGDIAKKQLNNNHPIYFDMMNYKRQLACVNVDMEEYNTAFKYATEVLRFLESILHKHDECPEYIKYPIRQTYEILCLICVANKWDALKSKYEKCPV